MKTRINILFGALLLSANMAFANNVQISSITVLSTTQLSFNITWNNSWYVTGGNYDRVWIFIKNQDCSIDAAWYHVPLTVAAVTAGFTSPSGTMVCDVASDHMGIIVRQNGAGNGTMSGTITVTFGAITNAANDNFHVFGIEMVDVPQASFQVGDGSTGMTPSQYSFGLLTNAPNYTYTISSEALISNQTMGTGTTLGTGTCNNCYMYATFPKGYQAFYCMKYDISQEQYVAFLNDLNYPQQVTRTAVSPASAALTFAMTGGTTCLNRSSIAIQTPSSTAIGTPPAVYGCNLDGTWTDGNDIACNYLSWADLCAYLWWAALRPLSELEYEKACRGINQPVPGELAWGNTTVTQALSSSLTNPGLSTEVSTASGTGLCAEGYTTGGTVLGPLRVGFAATSTTSRTTAGSTFYGIMDMSGNLWQQCETVGYYTASTLYPTTYLVFTGDNGNGALDANGNCQSGTWNWGNSLYSIVKGGNWQYAAARAAVSDRYYVNSNAENNTRVSRTGGRGGRRIPL